MRTLNPLQSSTSDLQALLGSLSNTRRRQLIQLQVLSLLAAAGEVANLGALLPFLQILANSRKGLNHLGTISSISEQLPIGSSILMIGLGFIAIAATSSFTRTITIRFQQKTGALIAADLGESVFANVLARPYAWHIQQNSSSTLGHLTKDVDQVFQIIEALLNFTVNLVIVIFLLAGLISIAPTTMLIVGSLLAAFYLFTYCITQRDLKRQGARLSNSYQRSLQVAQEALGGIRDIILDHTRDYFVEEYKRHILEYRGAMARINIYNQIPRFLIEGFAIILIASISLAFTLAGSSINSILPVLGTLVLGSYRLLQPLQQCFNSVGIFQANKASLAFITDYLGGEPLDNTHSQQKESADPSRLESPRKPSLIEARNISFRYKEGKPWVLRNLDLAINQGDRIAFVGSTGSGKTTFCDILLGLLKPTDGKILIQGSDLHASRNSQDLWRDRVAHVPQSIYLVDGSFVENIAFGLPPEEVDMGLVVQSAEAAHIADFIKQTSRGYDTIVGERGARLSGGQRQRIGIARALYKQAKLLVLDEATSALDNKTEADVMSTFSSLGSDYTVIAIAHRLTTLRGFSQIFLLENGSIKAEGTYEEMMNGVKGFKTIISTS